MVLPLFDQNPTRSKPVVTQWLIWSNILLFIFTRWLENRGVSWIPSAYGMVPARLSADFPGEAGKIISSMFLHASWTHLGLNMLYLHIFGDNVEDALGRKAYFIFYLLSGAAGAGAQFFINPDSSVPMVGASGAIAGVLGAYMVLYPRVPIVVFNPFILPFPILPFPSWLVIGWWFFLNVMGELFSTGSPVAYLAHIGGFVLGLVYARMLVDKLHTNMPGAGPGGSSSGGGSWGARPHVAKQAIFPKDDKTPFWR